MLGPALPTCCLSAGLGRAQAGMCGAGRELYYVACCAELRPYTPVAAVLLLGDFDMRVNKS